MTERSTPKYKKIAGLNIGEGTIMGKKVRFGLPNTVGERCVLARYCSLGSNTVLEQDVEIGASSIIGGDCKIGRDTRLGSHCETGRHTTIGPRVRLASNTKIGHYSYIGEGVRLTDEFKIDEKYTHVYAIPRSQEAIFFRILLNHSSIMTVCQKKKHILVKVQFSRITEPLFKERTVKGIIHDE